MLDVNCTYALITSTNEPRTMKEATEIFDSNSWLEAMNEEMASLKKNATWDLVSFPKGRKPIGCKWVFKKKISLDGSVEKYKARFLLKNPFKHKVT